MKRTTFIGALGLVMAAGSIGFAQRVDPAKVKINGVGLDSTYAKVVKAIGKPVKDGKPREEGCIGAREKEVEYDGLSFYFMDGDSKNGKTFEVKGFEVTSRKWIVSGIRIGDTAAMVLGKYGRKHTSGEDVDGKGDASWTYEMDDNAGPGQTTVVFKRGKVIRISSAFQVC